jgi:hypothetical protein
MSIVVDGNQATITADGSRRYFYVPSNVKSGTVEYLMIGGGGGGGGTDWPYQGGNGGAAGVVTGTVQVNAGDVVEIVVGGAGRVGAGGAGSAAGGNGGLSYADYSGGAGGNSGPSGSSGAGGGGGGATVLKVNGIPKAIAAGGAGGGGGGHQGWQRGEGYPGTVIQGATNITTENNYYNPTSNRAYCEFLNTYGVDIGWGYQNVTYQWDVYFPTTHYYFFWVSGDNEADILCDGVQIATTGNWGGGGDPFQNYFVAGLVVSAGWHSITINGRNYGGPGSIGGRITFETGGEDYTTDPEIWNSRNARSTHISTNGQHGGNHPGDGGGGGGGGGGYLGGAGGLPGGGYNADIGGFAGSIGYNYVESGGVVLPQVSDKKATYLGTYGDGGNRQSPSQAGTDGGDGYALIVCRFVTRNLHHKNNGVWKATANAYVKDNGDWKTCSEIWIKDNGVWKRSLLKTTANATWLTDTSGTGYNKPVPPPPTPTPPTPPVVITTTCPVKGTYIRSADVTEYSSDGTVITTYNYYADGLCGEYAEFVSEQSFLGTSTATATTTTFVSTNNTTTTTKTGIVEIEAVSGTVLTIVSSTATSTSTATTVDNGVSSKTGTVEIEVVDDGNNPTNGLTNNTNNSSSTSTVTFDDGSTITYDSNGNVAGSTQATDGGQGNDGQGNDGAADTNYDNYDRAEPSPS